MPGFIAVSGDLRLSVWITDDKSIEVGVFCQPSSLFRVAKTLIQPEIHTSCRHVDGQSGLVFAASGFGGHSIGSGLSPGSNIFVVNLFLAGIGAVSGNTV